ncbi:MAG: superoxide dismutase [Phycisphaerae bacterium]
MRFELPPLTYDYHALAPVFGRDSLKLHHDSLHAEYIRRLNDTLDGRQRDCAHLPCLEEMLWDIGKLPADLRQPVRNFGGGHLNHTLFWQIMSPGGRGEPDTLLQSAIEHNFGGMEELKAEFFMEAMSRFGSGWVWLVLDIHDRLVVVSTPNQDSPLMLGMAPVLGLDLWEHAYLPRFGIQRGDYVKAWWDLINWETANRLRTEGVETIRRAYSNG